MREPSPTIYKRLMDHAIDEPEREFRSHIEERVSGFAAGLAEELAQQLRLAYTAGVADGFRDAVAKAESNGDGDRASRLTSILVPLLLVVKSDHPDGQGVEGLASLLSAADRELSTAAQAAPQKEKS